MANLYKKDSPFQVYISFKKYLDVLEHIRYNDRLEYRANYAESLIERTRNFKELKDGFQDISILEKNEDLIRSLLADLFPTGLTRNEIKAASIPLSNITFNYTERFKDILKDAGKDFEIELRNISDDEFYVFCCCLILQSYFKKDIKSTIPFYYDIPNKQGIMKHYKITVNSDFTEIYPTEGAKIPSDDILDMLLENLDDFKLWKKYFPSQSWILKGFTIISLVDCTSEVALSDLKSSMIEIDPEDLNPNENLTEIFKSYFDVAELNFGLMTFNKKEQKLEKLPIYESVLTNHILDFWINAFDEEARINTFNNLSHNSKPIVVSNVNNLDESVRQLPSFNILKDNNVNSFMVIPIMKDNDLLAIMEFTSPIAGSFNGLKLKKMEFFSDMILFSLSRFYFEKNYQIEAIIQREYTSIHDSVVWKFRNEAEKYFTASLGKKIYTLKQISFKNLTPLFGVSDIRSSSEKRFNLMLQDLNQQIEWLIDILALTNSDSEKFALALDVFENELNNEIKADTEQRFQRLLREEIHPFLQARLEMKSSREVKTKIKDYFSQVLSQTDLFYNHRKKLDDSITLLNRKLADMLDENQIKAQQIFPHYYERFKSDGVEHNLYIGHNIAPELHYTSKVVHKLRYWQLKTICRMELEFQSFKKDLPIPLDIASLIFVYNEKIDIRFRMDEKRFDVDGAYNSYYEIIKKRLDKAHVKDSPERITAPGKITIVYFGMENQKEYLEYVTKLQKKGILEHDVEFLKVEDLQGITGLLALRVSISQESTVK
ncbi:GAF domain-containing protein [Chryseobacterium rhizoplanae]|uniref:GAF domain-containing protein n=1 Tax=Chryseobacterium bernardetii TaxID=1241978 RepID=A0A3G6TA65_9FLAO|nr:MULTISPECIES: GAF domain-containing protein [Chryseobacterium]AZB24763.1 GAF domain-containing protein [Chryseobacterium bernardetii]UCA59215.1 GAF domain-containing protein [Chryseobacterium rhizoplanae]